MSRKGRRLAPLVVVLLVIWLSGCSIGKNPDKTVTIATLFPQSGADAAIGRSMQDAVDLAVSQAPKLPNGYKLAVAHVDETAGSSERDVANLVANHHAMGIVGPMTSESAVAVLPYLASNSVLTISPSVTLPGLTQAKAATAEGLTFTDLHPAGSAVSFFRLATTDDILGKVAADVAVGSTQSNGLGAQSVFVVDDGSLSGKAQSAAFVQELKAKQGSVAGQKSLTTGAQDNTQSVVSAIVDAYPSIVFYAGDTAGGAELRATLSLTGAPQMVILAAGPLANDPTWSASVGVVPASGYTTAVSPHPDLSTMSGAKSFVTAFQAAYPNDTVLAQSALAYDAAMDEITAINAALATGKPITHASVLAAFAGAKYAGVTGTLAFTPDGDNMAPLTPSLYTCDAKGVWKYLSPLQTA